MQDKKFISVLISDELYNKFKEICDNNNMGMSEVLRLDVIRIVEEEPSRQERMKKVHEHLQWVQELPGHAKGDT
jgi:antitoxin component of RelBE/YafQ-DinJ toxin-antitoxin module